MDYETTINDNMAREKNEIPYKGPRKMRAVFTVLKKTTSTTPPATAQSMESKKAVAPTKPRSATTASTATIEKKLH
jgi:hypothetical protein